MPTPFHPRTSVLNEGMRWKDWAGYFAANSYDTTHDREYYALRYAAGLIDVTPLFKYEVKGRDAVAFLGRVMAKDVSKLAQDQVTYCCWCDDEGKVVDDGTVWRLGEDYFRVTAAEPTYGWMLRLARRYEVTIENISDKLAALAVQGPCSRDLLKACSDADLDRLRFFRRTRAKLGGVNVDITRTGYTGDLGYEVWVPNDGAVKVFDAIWAAGRRFDVEACGIEAMDVTRVEAGFIMNGVDYLSAHHQTCEKRKSTPYEIGLGWTVSLKDRPPFIGEAAIRRELEEGPKRATVGLEIDWDDVEATYWEYGLPPEICNAPWRAHIPVYDTENRQIGRATSGTWSPILKKNLALANVDAAFAKPGTEVKFELTVLYERRTVRATVHPPMFFDPERKRSTPGLKDQAQPGLKRRQQDGVATQAV